MYQLRDVTEADYDFLFRLHEATMRPTVAQIWGWDDAVQAAYFREHWDPARNRIIVVDGRDAGVLSVEERPDVVFLNNIEIAPALQGKGLGAAIIRDIMAGARVRGLPVGLQVNRVNRARRLYARLGFVETGRTETHYLMEARPPVSGARSAEPGR